MIVPQLSLTAKMIPRVGTSALHQVRAQLRPRNGPTTIASLSALARLLSSLAVLEHRDGKLNHGSLGAVTAAQQLGGSITGFVAGGNIKGVAEEAAKVAGVEKIIAVDNSAYDKVLYFDILLTYICSQSIIGITRKLCSITVREYQERWIHTHHCRAHSIWQEPHAKIGSATRCPTNLRDYSD